MAHTCTNVTVTKDEKAWNVEVRAEIPAETLEKHYHTALKEVQKNAKLDGFRPGHAPIERVIEIYGEGAILRQAAEQAIDAELPELLASEMLPIVEAPKVTIGAPERGKSLSFTARAPLAPETKLADYHTIAKKHNAKKEEVTVSDDEHSQALTHIRRERARIEHVEKGMEPKEAADLSRSTDEKELPALDDAFVTSLGYESAQHFADMVRDNLKNEKEREANEKRRIAILNDIVKDSTIHYPAMLLTYELDDMEAHMSDDLAQMGVTLPAYLAEIKKTREALRDEWKNAAEQRVKVRLALADIARNENLEPDAAMLEHEVERTHKQYPDAKVDVIRTHIAHAMRNEKALTFLDGFAA